MFFLNFFWQQEAMERQTKLQEEQAAMVESLKNMQKKINEEKSIWKLKTSCLYCTVDVFR